MNWSILILLLLYSAKALNGQNNVIIPVNYSLFHSNLYSTNGSSLKGNCASFTNDSERNVFTCSDATSSVLFDGRIPTLTGDVWASQLLTLQANTSSSDTIEITFNFATPLVLIQRVEIVLLQCSQLVISALRHIFILNEGINLASQQISIDASCTSFSQICIAGHLIPQPLTIRFIGNERMHIAEVRFHADSSPCPPDSFVTGNSPNIPTTEFVTSPLISEDTSEKMDQESNMVTSTIASENVTTTDSLVVIVIMSTVVPSFLFILVCVLAALLLLWRCYSTKHHKHNTSPRSALREGPQPSPHPLPHPLSVCEETGQVFYYSSVHHEDVEEAVNPQYSTAEAEDSDEYAVPFHGKGVITQHSTKRSGMLGNSSNMPKSIHTHKEINRQGERKCSDQEKEAQTFPDLVLSSPFLECRLYAEASGECDETADQQYSSVDETKKNVVKLPDENLEYSYVQSHSREEDASKDQQYAEIKDEHITKTDPQLPAQDQQYAEVKKDHDTAKTIKLPSSDKQYAEIEEKNTAKTISQLPDLDQQYAAVDDLKVTTLAYPLDKCNENIPDHEDFYSQASEINDRTEHHHNMTYSGGVLPGEDSDIDESIAVIDPEIVVDKVQDEPQYAQVNKMK